MNPTFSTLAEMLNDLQETQEITPYAKSMITIWKNEMEKELRNIQEQAKQMVAILEDGERHSDEA